MGQPSVAHLVDQYDWPMLGPNQVLGADAFGNPIAITLPDLSDFTNHTLEGFVDVVAKHSLHDGDEIGHYINLEMAYAQQNGLGGVYIRPIRAIAEESIGLLSKIRLVGAGYGPTVLTKKVGFVGPVLANNWALNPGPVYDSWIHASQFTVKGNSTSWNPDFEQGNGCELLGIVGNGTYGSGYYIDINFEDLPFSAIEASCMRPAMHGDIGNGVYHGVPNVYGNVGQGNSPIFTIPARKPPPTKDGIILGKAHRCGRAWKDVSENRDFVKLNVNTSIGAQTVLVGTLYDLKKASGTIIDGTFILTDTATGEITAPIPWNATQQDVIDALVALPSIGYVTAPGGQLPTGTISLSVHGDPPPVLTVDSSGLVGGTLQLVAHGDGTQLYPGMIVAIGAPGYKTTDNPSLAAYEIARVQSSTPTTITFEHPLTLAHGAGYKVSPVNYWGDPGFGLALRQGVQNVFVMFHAERTYFCGIGTGQISTLKSAAMNVKGVLIIAPYIRGGSSPLFRFGMCDDVVSIGGHIGDRGAALAIDVIAGATTITLRHNDESVNYLPEDVIRIGPRGASTVDVRTVTAVNGDVLTLDSGLTNPHYAGEPVFMRQSTGLAIVEAGYTDTNGVVIIGLDQYNCYRGFTTSNAQPGTVNVNDILVGCRFRGNEFDGAQLQDARYLGMSNCEMSGNGGIGLWLRNRLSKSVGLRFNGCISRGNGISEMQRATILGATSGTLRWGYGGVYSQPVAYNAPLTTHVAALESIASIGPGNIVLGGGPFPGNAINLTFRGELAATPMNLVQIDTSSLGGAPPSTPVARLVTGKSVSTFVSDPGIEYAASGNLGIPDKYDRNGILALFNISDLIGRSLSNDFEAGIPGASISTGDAGSPSKFDIVINGPVYDNAHYYTGGQSARFGSGVTAQAQYLGWSSQFGTNKKHTGVIIFERSLNPSSFRFLRFWNGATQVCGVDIDTSGHLKIVDGTGAFISGGTFTGVVPVGQWVKLVWELDNDPASGMLKLDYYSSPGGTITETHSPVGNFGAQTTAVYGGMTTSTANMPDFFIDYFSIGLPTDLNLQGGTLSAGILNATDLILAHEVPVYKQAFMMMGA